MICPKPHIEEEFRQQSLEKFAILDSPRIPEFDGITALAATASNSPIALISFIDRDRQWFLSHHGLEIRETHRKYSFCAHAINSNEDILIIPDTKKDERFHSNPFVIDEPNVSFYAGFPILDDDNLPLGTLCIIDTKPKKLKDSEIEILKLLVKQTFALLKKRKLEKELNQSILKVKKQNKELEKFALDIAHDLKTPILNISAMSEYLSQNFSDDLNEERKTLLLLIKNSCNKLTGLIDGTLDYYTDGNKLQNELSSIEIKEFLNQIFELFNNESSVQLKLRTSLKSIMFNRTVLHHILTNLISNAIRYNDKNTTLIEIGVSENPQFLEFYVQDNGPGIPNNLHKKIFELFMVGQAIDKNGKKSSGVGLATVKKLVEGLGGTIWLENNKDTGCRFTFRVPNILKPLMLN